MTGPVDLFDAFGLHLRRCRYGATDALGFLRSHHSTAADLRLSRDQSIIRLRFPGSVKPYTYELRPVTDKEGAP